jgi:carbon-monoxide dehydrogenase small subunit
MLTSAKAFLDENPNPTEGDMREAIDGNICRCTGYNSILRAMTAVVNGEYREEK